MAYQESICVEAYDRATVHVSSFEDRKDTDVWLNIQHNHGGANCILSREQAKELIEALTKVVEA